MRNKVSISVKVVEHNNLYAVAGMHTGIILPNMRDLSFETANKAVEIINSQKDWNYYELCKAVREIGIMLE
jgi:hypothetical protein